MEYDTGWKHKYKRIQLNQLSVLLRAKVFLITLLKDNPVFDLQASRTDFRSETVTGLRYEKRTHTQLEG